MKPAGSAAAKKSRSEAVRRSPEQPKTTASGALSGNDAPDFAPLQLAADPVGIRDGGSLDTVKHPLFAEIGTNECRRDTPKQVWIRTPDTVPFLARGLLAAHRSELDPSAARRLSRCRFCSSDSSGASPGRQFAGGLLRLGLWRRIRSTGCRGHQWRAGGGRRGGRRKGGGAGG